MARIRTRECKQRPLCLYAGPSEFGIAGVLETWDNLKDLSKISATTLVTDASRKDYVRNPVA